MRPQLSALAAAGALLVALACATASAPFSPLGQSTPDRAWAALQSERARFDGARSFVRIRVTEAERSRSFKAKLSVDPAGRFLIEGVTPVGTPAFTLFAAGRDAVWIDQIHRTWWKGDLADLGTLFASAGAGRIPMLLIGLPAEAGGTPGEDGSVETGGVRYRVSASGLAGASVGSISVSYEPPSFPPVKLRLEYGASALEIEHLELSPARLRLSAPRIDPSYSEAKPSGLGVE